MGKTQEEVLEDFRVREEKLVLEGSRLESLNDFLEEVVQSKRNKISSEMDAFDEERMSYYQRQASLILHEIFSYLHDNEAISGMKAFSWEEMVELLGLESRPVKALSIAKSRLTYNNVEWATPKLFFIIDHEKIAELGGEVGFDE